MTTFTVTATVTATVTVAAGTTNRNTSTKMRLEPHLFKQNLWNPGFTFTSCKCFGSINLAEINGGQAFRATTPILRISLCTASTRRPHIGMKAYRLTMLYATGKDRNGNSKWRLNWSNCSRHSACPRMKCATLWSFPPLPARNTASYLRTDSPAHTLAWSVDPPAISPQKTLMMQ